MGAAQLSTVYQYNHQSGTLHLPLGDGAPTPVAIKVCPISAWHMQAFKHPAMTDLSVVALWCRRIEGYCWRSSPQEIRAEGRRFPALGQVEMQHAVRAFLSKLEQIDPLSAPTDGMSTPCLFPSMHACIYFSFFSELSFKGSTW